MNPETENQPNNNSSAQTGDAANLNQASQVKSDLSDYKIYAMPENWQKHNQVIKTVNKKGSLVFLIGGGAFILVLAAFVYLYLVNPELLKKNQAKTTTPNLPEVVKEVEVVKDKPVVAATTQVKPITSPKESYLQFKGALAMAKTYEEILVVYQNYGSQLAIKKIEALKNQADALNTSKTLDGTEDFTEEIASDNKTAVLIVKKTNNKNSATIKFVVEANKWRLDDETWIETTSVVVNTSEEVVFGLDDDKDGLTNAEETLLNSNPNNTDTDGDGYSDSSEVTNGFNPAGKGKLSENVGLITYINKTFDFSILMPANWESIVASSDDSVIFKHQSNQYFQILVQPNANNESIEDWYKNLFSITEIDEKSKISGKNWNGLLSPDGLTTYLVNQSKSLIFTITYNPGTSNKADYSNLFKVLTKSLDVKSK